MLAAYADGLALTIAIAGITYFSIVIGELVPKSIAMNQPEKFALFSVPILRYFTMIVYPFVMLLSVSTTFVLRLLRIPETPEEKLSEEELISLLKNASRQ
jgi:putative hemolysin